MWIWRSGEPRWSIGGGNSRGVGRCVCEGTRMLRERWGSGRDGLSTSTRLSHNVYYGKYTMYQRSQQLLFNILRYMWLSISHYHTTNATAGAKNFVAAPTSIPLSSPIGRCAARRSPGIPTVARWRTARSPEATEPTPPTGSTWEDGWSAVAWPGRGDDSPFATQPPRRPPGPPAPASGRPTAPIRGCGGRETASVDTHGGGRLQRCPACYLSGQGFSCQTNWLGTYIRK